MMSIIQNLKICSVGKKSEHAHLKKSFSDSAAASPENKLRKKHKA